MLSNKIKPMPISKLVFYKTYQEQSPYCEKEIDKMLKSKMKKYKLNLDPIIFYDKKVIITRQNRIEDYLFDYHRGFRETLQQFHKHLYIPGMNDHTNRILSRDLMVKDLTFSELYLYYDLLKKVQNAYDMRIRLLEEYLEQLDMNNTTIATGTGNLSGYWKWNEDDGYIPTGAIISNIQDMSKYLEILITSDENCVIKTQEPLKDVNVVNEIYDMFDVNVDSVGMTWMIDNKNNIIWHNGSTTNFNSYIGFNREKKVGIVVLSNISPQKDVNMTLIGNRIMHELL